MGRPINLWLPAEDAKAGPCRTDLQANDLVEVRRTEAGMTFQFRRGDVFLVTSFTGGDTSKPVHGRMIEAVFTKLDGLRRYVEGLLPPSHGLEVLDCREKPARAEQSRYAWMSTAVEASDTEITYVEFRIISQRGFSA